MSFTLLFLLGDKSKQVTTESLALGLNERFRDQPNFSLDVEDLPYTNGVAIALRWSGWPIKIIFEQGEEVLADSREIQKILNEELSEDVSARDRRIRVVFRSDADKDHIDLMMDVIDFLERIEDVVIFDRKRGTLFDS